VTEYAYHAFVSYAGEDREFVARLVQALSVELVNVWYDQHELKIGQSLRKEVDRGLRDSRFGIVVLSESFFAKPWPQIELDSLVSDDHNRDRILPILHGISHARVKQASPILASRVSRHSDVSLSELTESLLDVLLPGIDRRRGVVLQRLAGLCEDVVGFIEAQTEGPRPGLALRHVLGVVRQCLNALRSSMVQVRASTDMWEISEILARTQEVVHAAFPGYCVRCKEKREMANGQEITMKNGRRAAKGHCPICGTGMYRILGR
jgi:TIR domain/Domain of unknown function (DUF5679)